MSESMSESTEFLRHRSLHARGVHPQGGKIEFARDDLEKSIPWRFEKIVAQLPDCLAVKAPEGELTYRALDELANRLAHAILHVRGPAAEPVGVLVQHGVPMIVGTLAVLKAGKFYVPLDPQSPSDRLKYVLDDTNASLIITDGRHRVRAEELLHRRIPILNMDDCAAMGPQHPTAMPITPDAICGIYYTSGSTGRPKGIVYTHRYLLHNMMSYGNAFHVSPHDRWSLLHSYSFSPALTDIFCPLLHGATVCPWNIQGDGLAGLGDWLVNAGVTIFHWMATAFRSFAPTLSRSGRLSSVRLMIFGSEKLFARDVNAFRELFSSECIFANRMGASETGLYRFYLFDKDSSLDDGIVPAGYPIPEKTALILDETGSELAAGSVGEIAVRSHFLPPGYWQRPEITGEKFRPDVNAAGARVFLTGDLGRMRADGCLEFHGRRDSQVKIRGHRIETDEIETVLRDLGGIREAVVKGCGKPSGETCLTAYFVPTPDSAVDEAAARRHLLGKLPAYMIPAAFVRLEKLPLSPNGKIDVAALPAPNLTTKVDAARHIPPRTPLQRHLVEIWQAILEIQPIGIDDDFFELGGDSLAGMRMVNQLQPLLNSILHVPPLFEHSTISRYAEFLESNYGPELNRVMCIRDSGPAQDVGGLDEVKLGLVRAEIAALPVAGPSIERRERKNPSAIFVLAPGRSGTTLLRVILGGHPQLFAPPELHLLPHATMDLRRSVILERWQRQRLDGAVQAQMTARGCSLEEAECQIRTLEDARLPVAEFYRLLQSQIAPRRLIDKTPSYALRTAILERAEELFDRPLYVHLLRHPYGVIRSYEEMHMDQLALIQRPARVSLREFSEALWLIAQENILEFLSWIPDHRQTRLRFEDLVKHPRETISALCQFLNVDLHPGMLDPYEERQQRMTDQIRPMTLAIGDPKFHHHKGIDPEIADRWRQIYHEDFLCAATWRIAERLGYSRTSAAASVAAS
jgi:amino acid adenylation domain-containing protein